MTDRDNKVPEETPPADQASRRRWLWPVILLIMVGAGIGLYLNQNSKSKPSGKPQAEGQAAPGKGASQSTPVVAVPARKSDVGVYLTGLGSVTPLNTVSIKSRVDGQLMEVRFREGQTVRKGDLLAMIDPRPSQVQLT